MSEDKPDTEKIELEAGIKSTKTVATINFESDPDYVKITGTAGEERAACGWN